MTTLLIDGDIVVYQIASRCEEVWTDENNVTTGLYTNLQKAKVLIAEQIEKIKVTLKGTKVILCFTDGVNFRKTVLPTYKMNRADTRKPMGYYDMREWVMENYECFLRPTLEGDDCLGILATHPKLIPGEKIIVSEDKDMKTIPGLFCHRLEKGVIEVTPEEADFWHMYQTITGDTTDGYGGCPGIGPDKAEKMLKAGVKLEPYDHVLKGGPRKGQVETRWREVPAANHWETVVSLYEKQGLTEADALVQARCARILQWTDFDFKKKEVILWKPTIH